MKKDRIDWLSTLVPFVSIISLTVILFVFPKGANSVIERIRFFFGDSVGLYYLVIGLVFFGMSLYLAFSKYGKVMIGDPGSKPKYSFWQWGSMMFTCGLAADILFYSFGEWLMYASNPHVSELGDIYEWAGVFPLFHWSFIPWSFYLVLAVAFGFMVHVSKRTRMRFSEACRPIIGKAADGIFGRIIDLFALFALLAGTATTFSVATPLLSTLFISLFHIEVSRTVLTIIILVITCVIYTYAAIHGFNGIGILAKICMFLFFGLLVLVFCIGGQARFILENGFQSFGMMIQHFVDLSTYTDPGRTNMFPQDWTIYYWAYWMVWCIAAPFFIGNISQGRSIRQIIVGGYLFGVGSTIVSFVVLGNYSLGLQTAGKIDFLSKYVEGGDMYETIISIIDSMPATPLIMAIIILTMIAFYSTSFDSIAYTAACYSYKNLTEDEHPHNLIIFIWCILLIVLPIGLVFSESSMNNIQSVSIIAAFPIGIIMMIMVAGLFRSLRKNKDNAECS
ncbi:MAG: BCCT family transporter [Lachnospiraceae bacterium]|nr:BCCT family transporter [Lachnospiraceae bacterium]